MKIINGTCVDCGNAEHECECPTPEEVAKAARTDKVEEYLLAMPVQVKPGTVRFNRFLCFDCLGHADQFMVPDALWHTAWPTYRVDKLMMRKRYETMYPEHHEPSPKMGVTRPKKGKGTSALLCLPCLEQRHGKALRIEDFTNATLNNSIRFAFMMGVDAERAAAKKAAADALACVTQHRQRTNG